MFRSMEYTILGENPLLNSGLHMAIQYVYQLQQMHFMGREFIVGRL